MVYSNLQSAVGFDIKLVNGLASLALIALAIFLVVKAVNQMKRAEPPPAPPAPSATEQLLAAIRDLLRARR